MFHWLSGRSRTGPAARAPERQAPAREPADITPEDLAQALAGPNPPLVIDVRSPAEYASGHIRQAVLLPLAHLQARMGELPRDRSVVCVCRSGSRSAVAAHELRAQGYAARNMTGGMLRWRGPVVTGTGR